MTLVIPTSADMERWGSLCAGGAEAGDVIVLTGELGAGKTTFARGFGEALDLDTPVSSPTFIVARTPPRKGPRRPTTFTNGLLGNISTPSHNPGVCSPHQAFSSVFTQVGVRRIRPTEVE